MGRMSERKRSKRKFASVRSKICNVIGKRSNIRFARGKHDESHLSFYRGTKFINSMGCRSILYLQFLRFHLILVYQTCVFLTIVNYFNVDPSAIPLFITFFSCDPYVAT